MDFSDKLLLIWMAFMTAAVILLFIIVIQNSIQINAFIDLAREIWELGRELEKTLEMVNFV